MKKLLFLLLAVLLICPSLFSQPKITLGDLLIKTELNPAIQRNAAELAKTYNLPVEILIKDVAFIVAKDIENGKVVYAVMTNFLHPSKDGYTAFYEDIEKKFDFSKARIRYGDGTEINNSGINVTISPRISTKLYMVPDWTADRVMAFDFNTGDLVDPNFIPTNNPNLQSPKHALQRSVTRILVSDQISDAVQEYDSSGVYIRLFAPASGINPAIMDNLRGIAFRPNGNLLVTVASSGNANTVQEFDTGGVHLGTFILSLLNSPFAILYRTSDILVTNSSGTNDVTKYDFNGSYLGNFITNELNFPQQIIQLPDTNLALCEFSGTGSGIKIYTPAGTLLQTLSGVTGNRGVVKLPGGNFLTTNGTGLHEIDDTTGALVRTIVFEASLQYLSVFDPYYISGTNNTTITTPSEYKLYDNYPNPFNPSTTIKYSVPKSGFVKLEVYDALGRNIKVLENTQKQAGTYEILFDASGLPSGVYFYKISIGDFTDTKKMLLIK